MSTSACEESSERDQEHSGVYTGPMNTGTSVRGERGKWATGIKFSVVLLCFCTSCDQRTEHFLFQTPCQGRLCSKQFGG